MFFLPKGMGAYWGIGLVKVVWKVFATMVDCRIKKSVSLHDALHGLRVFRFKRMSTLEAKLMPQLAGIAQKLLFQVFLDVQKAYNSLDRGWCMEIMWGYGMGQIMARLIAHHWENLMSVRKAKRFLGTSFVTGRGVMQGYPTSPMISNIVVDAVVRATFEVVCGPQ